MTAAVLTKPSSAALAGPEEFNRNEAPGSGRSFDHVFLLHTHDNEQRVARLCRRLLDSAQNAFVLISHDRDAKPLSRELFDRPDVIVIAGDGGRADFTIVDGYLAALAKLDEMNITYRWVSNLSGQDYPIGSLHDFQHRCDEAGDVDGFIHHFPAFESDDAAAAPWTWSPLEGRQRYGYRYRRWKKGLSKGERALVWPLRNALDRMGAPWRINPSYGLMIGTKQVTTPFGRDFRCFAGSHWHTLNRRCIDALKAFVVARPDIVAYFRAALQPEEAFVQTVLANTPGLRLANDNLRHIDMRGSRHGRPRIFTEADLPELLSSGKFFARKFGGDADPLFDRIDRIMAERDGAR